MNTLLGYCDNVLKSMFMIDIFQLFIYFITKTKCLDYHTFINYFFIYFKINYLKKPIVQFFLFKTV